MHAEKLLDPSANLGQCTTVDLRLRYLHFLLEPYTSLLHSRNMVVGPSHQAYVDLSLGPKPSTAAKPSQDMVLTQDSLCNLAWATGCEEVLQDLQTMFESHDTLKHGTVIDNAYRLFARGTANLRLGGLQQSISSVYLARQYNEMKRKASLRARTRSSVGRGTNSMVYDEMLQLSSLAQSPQVRKRLRKITQQGQRLLRIERVSGSSHPIWMLFPTKTIKCPKGTTANLGR